MKTPAILAVVSLTLGAAVVGTAPAGAAVVADPDTPTVTASASLESFGWSKDNLVDGVTSSLGYLSWHFNDDETKNAWVQLDLHASTAITQVTLWPTPRMFPPDSPPRPSAIGFPIDYEIQVSDDVNFGTYNTFASRTGVANPVNRPVDHTGSATGRFVRVDVSRLGPNRNQYAFALAEITLNGATPVAPQKPSVPGAPIVTTSSSHEGDGWAQDNLVDGLTAQVSGSLGYRSETSKGWIQLDLHAQRPIAGLTLWPAHDYSLFTPLAVGFPEGVDIQVSNDPTFATFTTLVTVGQQYAPTDDPMTVAAPAGRSETGRYIRLVATKENPYAPYLAFTEIQVVYGSNTYDVDGDGISDILARNSKGQLVLYPGAGDGTLKPSKVLRPSGWSKLTAVSAGDKTEDGVTDVIARDSSGGLRVYPGDGAGGIGSLVKIGTGFSGYTLVSPGDFNGDRLNDLIARHSGGNLWLFPGSADGKFSPKVLLAKGWKSYTSVFSPGDFNSDGFPDIVTRDTAGNLWLFPGAGTTTLGAQVKIGTGFKSAKTVFSRGDFTGDRKADILTRDSRGDIWLYPGDGAVGIGPRIKVASGWTKITPSV